MAHIIPREPTREIANTIGSETLPATVAVKEALTRVQEAGDDVWVQPARCAALIGNSVGGHFSHRC
ncbi:hypothetical protein D3C72_1806550 [compost metagenome]